MFLMSPGVESNDNRKVALKKLCKVLSFLLNTYYLRLATYKIRELHSIARLWLSKLKLWHNTQQW